MPGEPQKRVLVIGCGSIGERHVRCFQSTSRAEVSICERNDTLRRTVAERYAIENQFANVEDALESKWNAAVIATPAHLHISIAQQLADAGAHLLIEKPLAVSLDGVDRLRETISHNGRIAAVAYVYRADPALAAMKKAIESGRFGPPVQLVAVSGQDFPSLRPAYRETYYRDRATGGGAIQDALTHLLNAGEWLVGPIDRLVADAAHQLIQGVEVEDTAHILARHGSVLASYALNQHQAPNENVISVICERGVARCELHKHRWRWMAGDAWREEPTGEVERDTLFVNQANAFLDAIEQREAPLCTLEEGLRTLHANLAALASIENREWRDVRVEPIPKPN